MKKYKIIYADPPWKFKVWSNKGKNRSAEKHYKIMSLTNIKHLAINKITDKDCILFLWTTFPNLKEAFEVINSWGFNYKTVAFTWIKKNKKKDTFFMGLGYWTRANPEICLLATKGKIKRISSNVKNLTVAKIRKHSQKPDEVRNKIVQLMGDLPRIELFARQKTPGWDIWGNELPNDIEIDLNASKKSVEAK